MMIYSLFVFLLIFVGCSNQTEEISFQRYVDYSGMMIDDLKTYFLPDSLIVLNLGAICIDSYTQLRYNKWNEEDSRSHPCFRMKDVRNYFDSVPVQLQKCKVDSLLLNTNEIHDVPNWLLKKKLKHLDLSANKIQSVSIPEDCQVESIDLRENQLSDLPDGTFQCEKLKVLYLDKSLKKHSVLSDTILVQEKRLVFDKGVGELDLLERLKARFEDGHFPYAIRLEQW